MRHFALLIKAWLFRFVCIVSLSVE